MQKLCKYVPTGANAPITFASKKGNLSFLFVGDEKTIPLEQYNALIEESTEFKTCVEMRVIVTSNVPEPVSETTPGSEDKTLTESDEQLSATPKKSKVTT